MNKICLNQKYENKINSRTLQNDERKSDDENSQKGYRSEWKLLGED